LQACLDAGQTVDVEAVLRAIARSHAHHGAPQRRAA
jgi:hypothetical protein